MTGSRDVDEKNSPGGQGGCDLQKKNPLHGIKGGAGVIPPAKKRAEGGSGKGDALVKKVSQHYQWRSFGTIR